MRVLVVVLALAGTITAGGSAEARKLRRVDVSPVPVPGAMTDDRYANLRMPEAYATARSDRGWYRKTFSRRRQLVHFAHAAAAESAQVIGGRPAGCPRRFCGCALALKIFGHAVPQLNLAANWLAFPRAAAAPGMVAARRGHVFQLLAHSGGNRWRVWDANSGRGRIRIHERSIAGYAIVNPDGQHLSASKRKNHRRN